VILAWHQQISGDIVVMNKPNWRPTDHRGHMTPMRRSRRTGRAGSNLASTATPKLRTSRAPLRSFSTCGHRTAARDGVLCEVMN
jgi:hypothetical protein